MTHLNNLRELTHQAEQEQRVVINKLLVAVNEAVLSQYTHSYGLVALCGGQILAECLERRLLEITNVCFLLAKVGVAVNDDWEDTLDFWLLRLQFFHFLLNNSHKLLRNFICYLYGFYVLFHNIEYLKCNTFMNRAGLFQWFEKPQ